MLINQALSAIPSMLNYGLDVHLYGYITLAFEYTSTFTQKMILSAFANLHDYCLEVHL